MKTLAIGLFFLGLTNLMYAQNEIAAVTFNSNTNTKTISTVKNVKYISAFAKEDLSKLIKKFQKIVADYDIKTESIYTSNEYSTYTVEFKEGNNRIVTIYNHDGNIVSSEGKFENVRLPFAISKDLSKKYPKWEFNKIQCSFIYIENGEPNISYKVLLKKGNKKKTVNINTVNYSM